MSFLLVTLPISLGIAAIMLLLVIQAAREGQFDDLEGPSARHMADDDATPELPDAPASEDGGASPLG